MAENAQAYIAAIREVTRPMPANRSRLADAATVPLHRLALLSLDIGTPEQFSVATGVAYSSRGFAYGHHGVSGSGVFAAIATGLGGTKAVVGYLSAAEMAGSSLQGIVIRTWKRPWNTTPNNTYFGAEGGLRFGPIHARLGLSHRTAGQGARWLIPATIGIGLP